MSAPAFLETSPTTILEVNILPVSANPIPKLGITKTLTFANKAEGSPTTGRISPRKTR